MYLITDSYGTKQIAWSWAHALEWLTRCAPEDGMIRNRITKKVLATRVQVLVY